MWSQVDLYGYKLQPYLILFLDILRISINNKKNHWFAVILKFLIYLTKQVQMY